VPFTGEMMQDSATARFERAVDAVVSGNIEELVRMLSADPSLVHARSSRRHRATLLHYVAANGVEDERQVTPANAIDVARTLLEAGADPDALADMYDHKCTTMSMLVSSVHPHEAGLQSGLALLLLDYGARLHGPGTAWQSALLTALAFGYLDTAKVLAERAGVVNTLPEVAGLGRLDDVRRLLPDADASSRHAALALAAQLGHTEIVRVLLDAGEDPSRYNPEGFHPHATPLHHAAWAGHDDVVRLLVESGARLDIRDTLYNGTPLGWARHAKKDALAEYLAERGAS
jgi:ankyrin repeat protein